MKKVILFMCLAVLTLTANSQSMKVQSAISDLRNKRLDRARTNIDDASVNESTKDDPKTWYYKAAIYYEIAITDKDKYKNLVTNPLEVAYESALKCNELDKNKEFFNENSFTLRQVSRETYNGAITYFNNKDYKNTLAAFERVLNINSITKSDEDKLLTSNARNYAGLTAEYMKDTATAVKYYQMLINSRFHGNRPYAFVYQMNRAKNDTVKSFDVANKWAKGMPNSTDGYIALASTYAWTKNAEKTNEVIQTTLNVKDTNITHSDLLTKIGGVYEQLGDIESAKAKYKEALKESPNSHNANFFLGALYFNGGLDKLSEAENVPTSDKTGKYDKLMTESKVLFTDAVPYLEKAIEINPKDISSMRALKEVYVRIDSLDKANAIDEKIKSLTNQ